MHRQTVGCCFYHLRRKNCNLQLASKKIGSSSSDLDVWQQMFSDHKSWLAASWLLSHTNSIANRLRSHKPLSLPHTFIHFVSNFPMTPLTPLLFLNGCFIVGLNSSSRPTTLAESSHRCAMNESARQALNNRGQCCVSNRSVIKPTTTTTLKPVSQPS